MTYIVPCGPLDTEPGQLGGKATLDPNIINPILDEPQEARILSLIAADQSKAQNMSISLDYRIINSPIGLVGLSNYLVRARIGWGSAKGNSLVEIDWKHGARVSLAGAVVIVDALYGFSPVPVGGAGDLGPVIEVFASVAAGTQGKAPPNTLTFSSGEVAAAGSLEILIPSYAVAVEIQDRRDPTAVIAPAVTTEIAAAIGVGKRIITTFVVLNTPITLPNGAETVEVTNTGVAATEMNVIFHLAI